MNIYPQDLGQGPCARILQWRGLTQGLGPDALTDTPSYLWGGSHYGFIGAMFGFSVGMGLICFFHFVPFSMDTSLLGGGFGTLLGYGCGYVVQRRSISSLCVRKITEQEISHVSKEEGDALKKDYLGIVSALIALPSPSLSEEQSIRNGVRSLGLAIEKLPMQPSEGAFVDPAALTAEAADLVEKAENEADPVVAASLSRQAASMKRRAETTARTAALARRNLILRQEIAEQINAFQTSIAAASMNGSQEVADFEALAESVAQVAQEANALADARAELDAPLMPLNTVAELATQTTRR